MQAPSNGTKDVRWPATRIKGRQLVLASSIWLAGLHSLSLAAQELETPRAVRDTFSISSGYFSKDYANNIDYAQFEMDVMSATSRLALYGYDKYADRLNGPFSRFGYLVASGWLYLLTDVGLAYHEWGHASRTVALGGTATLSRCHNRSCPAPRDFFGYAGSQVLNFKGGYARPAGNYDQANASSGKASYNIILGGGVNNETLVADKSDEHHFLRGSGNAFGHLLGNLAIASYGIKGPEGDIGMMAEEYRFKGVDKKITEDDLRNTNMLSLISGSTYTFARSIYDFSVSGKVETKPWTIGGFLVPNQYNYISSRGITRKWVSGYEWNESTKILGSYEYVLRGDSFAEPGLGIYKNFGGWDALVKVSGKTMDWANFETAFSMRMNKNWKLTATAHVWDSRSLLGERNSLKLKDNKTRQATVGVAYEY